MILVESTSLPPLSLNTLQNRKSISLYATWCAHMYTQLLKRKEKEGRRERATLDFPCHQRHQFRLILRSRERFPKSLAPAQQTQPRILNSIYEDRSKYGGFFLSSSPPPLSLLRCRRDWKFHEDEGSARRLPFANREPVSSATPSRIESNLSMARFPSRDTDSA